MFDKDKNALDDKHVDTGAHEGADKLKEKKREPRLFAWLLLVLGLGVGLMGGLYLYPVLVPEAAANAAPAVGAESLDDVAVAADRTEMRQAVMEAVLSQARHFEGDPDAPVTLVEFADFKCGYCGKWSRETLPLIHEKYVESGKVQIAHVSYPVLGPGSMAAAEAAECAARQGSFWEYANLLYENQRTGATPENLTAIAEGPGLDAGAFETCLAESPDRPSLEDDIRLGQMLGVRGTPAFLINGEPLSGALPYEAFEEIIEASLNGEF